jgi:hypothetical protein
VTRFPTGSPLNAKLKNQTSHRAKRHEPQPFRSEFCKWRNLSEPRLTAVLNLRFANSGANGALRSLRNSRSVIKGREARFGDERLRKKPLKRATWPATVLNHVRKTPTR